MDEEIDAEREHALRAQYLFRRGVLRMAGRAFSQSGIEAMLVKGAALAETTYEKPWQRAMDDIDMLVRPRDRQRAIEALEQAGCQLLAPAPDRRVSGRASGTCQLLFSRAGATYAIDLHTRLDKLVGRGIDYESVFDRSVTLTQQDLAPFVAPSPEDHLLLLVIHASAAEFSHPVAWNDLDRLFERGLDEDLVAERAERWRVSTSLNMVLRGLKQWGSVHVSPALVERCRPPWFRRQLLQRVFDVDGIMRRPEARQQGWRWVARQLPLRDDALRWCLGVLLYGVRRVADRVNS